MSVLEYYFGEIIMLKRHVSIRTSMIVTAASVLALLGCSQQAAEQAAPDGANAAMGAGMAGAMGAGMAGGMAGGMAAAEEVSVRPEAGPVTIPNQIGDMVPVAMPTVALDDRASRPNVIYILVDDFGVGDVSYNGSEIQTPNLDQMTKDGVELDRFYAFPICSPTRTALMTGRSALDFGVTGPLDDRYIAAPKQAFLPQYFKAAGYDTYMVGKWHLGNREIGAFPMSRGFDYHYGFLGGFIDFFTHVYWDGRDWQRNGKTIREEGHATDLFTDDAISLIESHDGDDPFFMYLAYNAPHTPLQYREGATTAYDGMENEHRKVYAQMVDHMDEAVGEVRAALSKKGITEDTLIVFTSDNGGAERLGSSNGQLREGKGSVYEGGMRVPGIAVWPGTLPAGVKSEYPVFVQNWAPTLLEAAGITAQGNPFSGNSAWDGLMGEAGAELPGTTLVGSVQGDAVFEWPYKMLHEFARGRATERPAPELYNVINDPFETTELSAAEPEVYACLASILAKRTVAPSLAETGEPPERLYRDAAGNVDYNVRLKETTPPWAERAKGNGG